MVYKGDVEEILHSLPNHHDGKFGYVVYRVAYGNEERWTQFLERLDAHVQARFDKYPENQKLKPHFVWDVREYEAELKDASKNEVRRMFSEWVRSVNGSCNLTRYTACIYVDEEVMTSVIEDEEPGDCDSRLITRPKAFVKLIHEGFEETPVQWTNQEIPDDAEREALNAGDEGYPPVEGCKRRNVGWMKSSAKWLVTTTYVTMNNGCWDLVYARPPRVSAGG